MFIPILPAINDLYLFIIDLDKLIWFIWTSVWHIIYTHIHTCIALHCIALHYIHTYICIDRYLGDHPIYTVIPRLFLFLASCQLGCHNYPQESQSSHSITQWESIECRLYVPVWKWESLASESHMYWESISSWKYHSLYWLKRKS